MPTYETPEPISASLDFAVGNVQITATDRSNTVVDVRPTDPSDESDIEAAQQVKVDFTDGALRITGPKRVFDFSHKTRSVDVTIELPAGSQVSAEVLMGDCRTTGQFGDSRIKTSAGNVVLDRTGALRVRTSAGNVTVAGVAGDVDISTGTGKVHIGDVAGSAVIKNSNGDTTVGAVTGDVQVRAANGSIAVQRAGGDVDAKSSNGSILIGEVSRGSVALATAMGDLEVGIAEGTAAWLEINTTFGKVHNQLETTSQPGASDETVEIRGRTSYGDITIRRS